MNLMLNRVVYPGSYQGLYWDLLHAGDEVRAAHRHHAGDEEDDHRLRAEDAARRHHGEDPLLLEVWV